jgi:hypothetical protein
VPLALDVDDELRKKIIEAVLQLRVKSRQDFAGFFHPRIKAGALSHL